MFWAALYFYSLSIEYLHIVLQLHIAFVHTKCTVLLCTSYIVIHLSAVARKYDFQPELLKQSNNDKNPKVSLAIELHQ